MAHKNENITSTIPSWMADVKEDAIKTQVSFVFIRIFISFLMK
jgi:hypothetical protein